MAIDIIGQVVQGIMYILYFMVGAGSLGYFFFIRKFNNILIERHQTRNGELIQIHKCREYTDSNKTMWWQKLKGFKKISVPPPEAIQINHKGKKFVECAVSPEGGVEYLEINSSVSGVIVNGLSTNDRLALINEIELAHAYKKKSLGETLLVLAPLFAVVIISVSLMVFWSEMAQPVLQAQELQTSYASIQLETLETIQEINLNVQNLGGGTPSASGVPQ